MDTRDLESVQISEFGKEKRRSNTPQDFSDLAQVICPADSM